MKTRQVLCLTIVILLTVGWQASVEAQDIPANYIQNPNMEHELNAIFWYGGWDYVNASNGIARFPDQYLTNVDSHSGNWSLKLSAGGWIWVSYPIRGQEQKKMKASFWYKGYMSSYWNFIYRDVGMTYDDLHPTLADFTGADSAVWGGEGQDAMQFLMGGEDGFTEDWTYFEFVWDMPGTLPGWGNTTMWWCEFEPAYVDDLYYGEWYDGQYSGEEPFDFINGDFEATELNIEWLLNVDVWSDFGKDEYLSWTENKTEAGLQSLRLQNYKTVSIDTIDKVAPIEADSILVDTTLNKRNVTYYLPALGAEGENMEMSFWYKGNDANVSLELYDDYGITTNEFPVPEGGTMYLDMDNPVYDIDTLSMTVDTLETFVDTFTVFEMGDYTEILDLQIDTLTLKVDTVLNSQNFDDESDLFLTAGAWVWSGAPFYDWNDWDAATKDINAFSSPQALWLPGDPAWSGAEGYVEVVDDTSYVWEFMYQGKMQFILMLGAATKYDLVSDPDGIVPDDPMIDSVTTDAIYWTLDSEYWKKFRYEYTQGSWLADSAVASPASVTFNMIGTYDLADLGFVDDFMVGMGGPLDAMVVDTNYVVVDYDYTIETTYDIDTLSTTYNEKGIMWDLPAAADWTEWMLKWTNPTSDIGGTLTLFLESETMDSPDMITPDKDAFDDDHMGWTFFDDFIYGITEPIGIDRNLVSYNLRTYPNPATDVLYLSIEIPLKRIEVYNSLGQLQMDMDHPERVLNISSLSDGIFFINATDDQGVVHKSKFIKKQ